VGGTNVGGPGFNGAMASIVAHLENLDRVLDEASRVAFRDDEVPDLADAEIAALLEISGRIQKRIEGLQIEATGQVVERSTPLREDKLTAKYGWSRPSDLVRVLTRSEMRDANRLVRVAKLLHRTRSMTSG